MCYLGWATAQRTVSSQLTTVNAVDLTPARTLHYMVGVQWRRLQAAKRVKNGFPQPLLSLLFIQQIFIDHLLCVRLCSRHWGIRW